MVRPGSPVADGTTIEGFAITALSANDIWAAGIYGRLTTNIPAINHWDGHSWSVVAAPDPGCSNLSEGSAALPRARLRLSHWALHVRRPPSRCVTVGRTPAAGKLPVGLGLVQSGVATPDELLERVLGPQLTKARADRCVRMGLLERGADLLESKASLIESAVGQRADELVSSDSDDRVIGAQMGVDRVDHASQQRVACRVTAAVVDLLQPIHVEEGARAVRCCAGRG